MVWEMLDEKQIRGVPIATDPAFNPGVEEVWAGLESAHQVINGMFWGSRIELVKATEIIRVWIAGLSL